MNDGPNALPRGFLARLAGLYITPDAELAGIARLPRFWSPFLAFVALGVVFNAVWLHKLDPAEFARAQIDESPWAERMSPEQRAEGIARQAQVFPFVAWLGPLVFSPLMLVLVSVVYLFVFRFFYGGEVAFKQSLSIVAWTFLAVGLVTLPLTLLLLFLKEDWNVDPRTAFQANLSLLLEKGSVPRPLYSLAESLDLFSAWMLALLSLGYGAATGRRAAQAAGGVVGVWGVYVVGKAALSAVF